MKITVERDLCESNQICCRACPEVFVMDDDDQLVLRTENPSESLREALVAAVQGCPRQALILEE